ncbi:2-dehydropantoate 2-reductase [Evansella sp. LMS18]|uniref:ketopantoate reductase family protein n=1 Tax=Evansella sp. LMS18 TaxID=2924033 RepID=UPI0020D09CF8|nr:2-dehydropantoate 2-reductase [Evansella sp. LMS18]UTR10981.1 2-dehydropantoate 2-reductase [Evansella sp. LMS18]
MRVAIIGGGAVGLLTGGYLSLTGHQIHIITRTREQADILNSEGLKLETGNGTETVYVNAGPHTSTEYMDCDLWIITLKQTVLDSFLAKWRDVEGLPPVLFLQNGMGHMEKAEKALLSDLYAGIVTHGALKTGHNCVKHTGKGDIHIGFWRGSNHNLAAQLTIPDSFPVYEASDIQLMLKRKLLVNLSVNPLTALYGVKNGELLTNPEWAKNVKAIFSEGVSVLGLEENEWETVEAVITRTGDNESSMLQDVKNGRKTETEAITGYMMQLAAEQGLELPVTSFLHRSITGIHGRGDAK